jgi:hypothetical protein
MRPIHLRRVLAFVVVFSFGIVFHVTSGAAQEAPPSTLGLEELIKGMKPLDEAFDSSKHSFLIHYHSTHHDVDSSGKIIANQDSWTDCEYARKGELAYVHLKRKTDDITTVAEEYYVWRDNISQMKMGHTVTVFDHLIPQMYTYYYYTNSICVNAMRLLYFRNVADQLKAFGAKGPGEDISRMFQPATMAGTRKSFHVRPRLEQVGETWCHVADWPNACTLWIDSTHGFLIRKVEHRRGERIFRTHINNDLYEAMSGVWLPRLQEMVLYAPPSATKGKPQAVSKRQYTKLVKIEFDTVADSLFKLPIGNDEAINVADTVRQMSYQRVPGEDPVEGALRRSRVRVSFYRSWFLVGNGIALGLVGSFFLWRYHRRRSK